MSIKFTEDGHSYESVDGIKQKWTSVTTAIHHFVKPFDSDAIALKTSKKKASKWFGMTTTAIQEQWKATNTYSLRLGTWYHKLMEDAILAHETIEIENKQLKIHKPIVVDGVKYAPEQKIGEGVYPEHMVFLKSVALCGQSDEVNVVDGKVNVSDFKTNKEIKLQSFKKWDGTHDMMAPPFQHLQDCNMSHYTLQLSLYMYMILKHNPQYSPGKITLKHILFEVQERDKFDNPVYKEDGNGNFFVQDTQEYEVPYLKTECQTLVNWMKSNTVKSK